MAEAGQQRSYSRVIMEVLRNEMMHSPGLFMRPFLCGSGKAGICLQVSLFTFDALCSEFAGSEGLKHEVPGILRVI